MSQDLKNKTYAFTQDRPLNFPLTIPKKAKPKTRDAIADEWIAFYKKGERKK